MNSTPLFLSICLALAPQPTSALQVELSFSKAVTSDAFSGRVFVIASKRPINEKASPPGADWFRPYPFFAQEVTNWRAETPLRFQPRFGLPAWDKLPKDKYYLQAILDRDLGGIGFHNSPGNGYSKPVLVDLNNPPKEPIHLVIDRVVAARKFEERPRVKYVEIESKLLSDFHKKPIKLRAAVVLPKSHADDPTKKYPAIYEIPGFGGDHFFALGAESRTDVAGVEMLFVVLDPNCRLGHHVFADSDNNGPYGKALTEELIPHVEAKYRAIATPRARFVTGHSSGGWSSLWLQVTYPDSFGGTWSTAPDPVDFRDFQMVDIYVPKQNIFFDAKGESRPIARRGKQVLMRYQPFNDMEVVMGRGGQLFSFEAVFSPKGKDGKPMPLWDRNTGVIDGDVANAWKRYDIRLILEDNWKTLGPKLAGKIHVYMGGEDTFYLEGATRLLQESQKKLGSDAVIEIFPGRDHGNLIDAALRKRIAGEMKRAAGR
ncbi:MAG: enterochelin esterase [Planctomycetes bacterium]|nr:enterochelin esterase [Planctomycetota bacterium]